MDVYHCTNQPYKIDPARGINKNTCIEYMCIISQAIIFYSRIKETNQAKKEASLIKSLNKEPKDNQIII